MGMNYERGGLHTRRALFLFVRFNCPCRSACFTCTFCAALLNSRVDTLGPRQILLTTRQRGKNFPLFFATP